MMINNKGRDKDMFAMFDEDNEDTKELLNLYKQLKRRCDDAGLGFRLAEEGFAEFDLPSGRDKRAVFAGDVKDIQVLLNADFEKYGFVASYEAIYSYENDTIEASLGHLRSNRAQSDALLRLFRADLTKNILRKPITMSREKNGSLQTVTIDKISDLLSSLANTYSSSGVSLKLSGFGISQHDQTKDLLERIARTVLYHFDVNNGISLALQKERQIKLIGNRSPKASAPLIFPQTEYPKEPMALYSYARGAERMPLLQFLAYYQAIEYFFPIYAEGDTKKRIQNLLKAPNFNIHSDPDIMRLLAVLKSNLGRGYGDERSQLRVTLEGAVDSDELRKFIEKDQARVEFFSKDKVLGVPILSLSKQDTDFRTDVANRLYAIRCKIVHTKVGGNEGEVDLLLPFSKEAESLGHDIDLAQYIAQQVINANGRELHI